MYWNDFLLRGLIADSPTLTLGGEKRADKRKGCAQEKLGMRNE